ncbi:MAG: hypothetical protein AABW65_03315 [Nanoarchaeota archaeon]
MFSILLASQSQRFLKKAEKEVRLRIWEKLDQLKINPFPSEVVRVISKKENVLIIRSFCLFFMSGTEENHTIHGVVVPEHPKHERLCQTTAFKPWWRIVLFDNKNNI